MFHNNKFNNPEMRKNSYKQTVLNTLDILVMKLNYGIYYSMQNVKHREQWKLSTSIPPLVSASMKDLTTAALRALAYSSNEYLKRTGLSCKLSIAWLNKGFSSGDSTLSKRHSPEEKMYIIMDYKQYFFCET